MRNKITILGLFFLLVLSFSVFADIDSGLMLYYPLENCTSIFEDSANVYDTDLSVTGSPNLVIGKVGNACNFSGSGMYAKNTTLLNSSAIRTIDYWYQNRATSGSHWVLSITNASWSQSQINFQYQHTGTKFVNYASVNGTLIDSGVTTIYPVILNNWSHAVFVMNGTHWIAYNNGVLNYSKAYASFPSVSTILEIGARGDNNAEPWLGYIDNVAVWDKPFNSSDVLLSYYAGIYNYPYPFTYQKPDLTISSPSLGSYPNITINFTCPSSFNTSNNFSIYNITGLVNNFYNITNGYVVNTSAYPNDEYYIKGYCFDVVNRYDSYTTPVFTFDDYVYNIDSFDTTECVLDKDLSYVIGYMALLFAMIMMIIVSRVWLKIPAIEVFIGVAFIVFTLPLYGCSSLIAIPFTFMGVFLTFLGFLT